MATGFDIVTGALRHLQVKASESTITAAEAQDGLISLNDMGEELESAGTPIGFKTISSLSDDVSIPRYAVGPYKALLAAKLAPEYGREVTQVLLALVTNAKRSLANASVHIGDVEYPSTLPRGTGNEDSQLLGDKFFPQNNGANF